MRTPAHMFLLSTGRCTIAWDEHGAIAVALPPGTLTHGAACALGMALQEASRIVGQELARPTGKEQRRLTLEEIVAVISGGVA